MSNTNSSGMFDHMNSKNLTQAEMDQSRKVKKRKLNDISKVSEISDVSISKNSSSTPTVTFKEPQPIKKTPQEIKECPFNPFGDDSCDMCGS